jgi:hypothetical protein
MVVLFTDFGLPYTAQMNVALRQAGMAILFHCLKTRLYSMPSPQPIFLQHIRINFHQIRHLSVC